VEECGEVAKEINHFENSGIKREKYGAPSKEKLANELRQAITALFQIAAYYSVETQWKRP
jgi:NTP pyrophosphatase (non-canonical NTP hydrolase)